MRDCTIRTARLWLITCAQTDMRSSQWALRKAALFHTYINTLRIRARRINFRSGIDSILRFWYDSIS